MTAPVSIIIPVYKVSRFIERCTESLMNQTLDNIEYIFVDDASPDDSITILRKTLERYPEKKNSVTIVHHDYNKGLASARNTGLSQAHGEYVFHCDSDDWVEESMMEELYLEAKKTNCDIVYCNFYISFEKNERYMSCPSYTDGSELLKHGFLGGRTKYNVWNKLIKRSIYTENGITFPEGHNMGEDMTMIMVAAHSHIVSHVDKALYHYVKLNSDAYSNTSSQKHLDDIQYNTNRTIQYIESIFGDSLEKELSYFKLNNKLPFLLTGSREQYNLWRSWYPEANKYVLSNKNISLRTRLLQWFASHNCYIAVHMYYILVYKLIYGIVYR